MMYLHTYLSLLLCQHAKFSQKMPNNIHISLYSGKLLKPTCLQALPRLRHVPVFHFLGPTVPSIQELRIVSMAVTSPVLRLLQDLHRWLLRIRLYRPQFAGKLLAGLFRRFKLLWRFFHSKLMKGNNNIDGPPKGKSTNITDVDERKVTYTVIQQGETISLDKSSFSLYPFSSDGIRSASRSSLRLGDLQSRSVSRTSHRSGSNYSRSVNGSIYDLSSNSVLASPANSPGQFSIPLPNIESPVRPHSPLPEIVIELASPVGPDLHDEFVIDDQHSSGSNHPTLAVPNHPYSPSCSPPPAILNADALGFHINGTGIGSSGNNSRTSFRIPSPVLSTPHFQLSKTNITPPNIASEITSLETSNISDENHTIRPVLPEETLRYTRRTRTSKEFKNIRIDELTTVFDKPAAPVGWLRYAHPEGACYHYHPEKRVYTDSHLSNPEILHRMMDDISRLHHLQETFHYQFPQNGVLMIDVNRVEGGGLETSYYYVDHDEPWDIGAAYEVNGMGSYRHLGYEMQAQYWYFVSLYPDSLALTSAMVCELRDIILYLIGDTMTSPYSTSPYTLDDLLRILNITSEMETRHMYIFYHTRFLNCHGETYARIERDFSIFGDPIKKRTWLVKTLSPILFSAPDIHLRNLQKMWVDGIMHKSVWEQSIKNMNEEWHGFLLLACVMLLANVAFLSISTINMNENVARSAAQILSYLSVVANLGTIILGLLLMRQNRTKMRDTADDVQEFLRARNHPRLGLETLAILYSLPYALLMWGSVAFIILIFWCIITSWENKNHTAEESQPLSYEERQEGSMLEEKSFAGSSSPKHSEPLFEKLRNLDVFSSIRRKSVESTGQTVV
ncbi:hypothetical protein BDN70DRAFT_924099 [Pholiota conissans]|uniref:Uncharacterized protein n=1 Tax=Pholiota conissans TaxID=109636 RepID=A0A9P5YTP9_9AGAR|nr:hypothetical protein BDN70DRAFT_924099 [Pholiota conissans]